MRQNISKNLVKAGVSDEILIQVGYAIGVMSGINVNTWVNQNSMFRFKTIEYCQRDI